MSRPRWVSGSSFAAGMSGRAGDGTSDLGRALGVTDSDAHAAAIVNQCLRPASCQRRPRDCPQPASHINPVAATEVGWLATMTVMTKMRRLR
jgi:hypothetical protein